MLESLSRRQNRYWKVRVMGSAGPVTKYLFLPSIESVRREVEQNGAYVLTVHERAHAFWQREYFSPQYKINFLQSLSFHVDVGSSPGQALMLVIDAERNHSKRVEMEPAWQTIQRGGTFADAIDALGLFPRPIIAILQAGELSGLSVAIEDALTLLTNRSGIIAAFVAAVGFLGFDLFTCFSTCVSVQYSVLPAMAKNVPAGATPEKLEQYRQAIEQGFFFNGILLWLSVAFIAAFAGAALLAVSGQRGRDVVSDTMATVPLFRRMIYDALMADNFLLLARMLSSKVRMMNAIRLLENVSPLQSLRVFWRSIHDSISAGASVGKAFSEQKTLLPYEVMILDAHGDEEQLAKIMLSLSTERSKRAKAGTASFIKIVNLITVFYMLAIVGIAIMILKIQDFGISTSFDSMTK
jgi:type II secretory pathway component PulF